MKPVNLIVTIIKKVDINEDFGVALTTAELLCLLKGPRLLIYYKGLLTVGARIAILLVIYLFDLNLSLSRKHFDLSYSFCFSQCSHKYLGA